jgi:putative SOS response-associated peptidase YedK
MCGRFGFYELKYFLDLLRQLELPFEENQDYPQSNRYNIPPETDIITLQANHGPYILSSARWGLIPYWAKELPKIRPINARAESLVSKHYYRHLLGRNHCLIPASGFYEWKRIDGKKKQPYYIYRADSKPMAFAGLWDSWKPKSQDAPAVTTCTIITTDANEQIATLHDRMPVVLEPENWKKWLEADPKDVQKPLVSNC